jgi:hypothetical protein
MWDEVDVGGIWGIVEVDAVGGVVQIGGVVEAPTLGLGVVSVG